MEIVSFEIAKKLKEKGFPQDIQHCIGWYPTEYYKNSCVGEYFEGELQEIEDYFGDRINAIHIIENEKKGVIAPTISQVLKWLREENKIFIDIRTSIDLNGKEHFSYYIIHNKVSIREGYTDFDWKFEQAALAGIEHVIDNLI